MENHILYKSEFLPDVSILVIFENHPKYDEISPVFKKFGYGFMVPKKNMVIIDGELFVDNFGMDVLKFVEAHEIAHVILGHDGPRNEDDEIDADLGAYILLSQKNYSNSISVLLDEFESRHGLEFSKDLLDRIKHNF